MKTRFLKAFIILFSIVFLFFTAIIVLNASTTKTFELKILGFNDFNNDFFENGIKNSYTSKLASYFKNSKIRNQNTLLLHNGNVSLPSSALYHSSSDELSMDILNYIGFDAGVPGIFELNKGLKEMKRFINGDLGIKGGAYKGASFPYLSTNIVDKKTRKPIFKPYVIKHINNVPICIIGAVSNCSAKNLYPSSLSEIEIIDEVRSVNSTLRDIRSKENVNAIILLLDNSNADFYQDNYFYDLTNKLNPDIDIIIPKEISRTEHDSKNYNSRVVFIPHIKKTPHTLTINQLTATIDLESLDISDVTYETNEHNFVDQISDSVIANKIESYKTRLPKYFNDLVATSNSEISKNQSKDKETLLGDFIADAYKKAAGTDFAFVSSSKIGKSLPGGKITKFDVFNANPDNSDLLKVGLPKGKIQELLEYASHKNDYFQVSGLSCYYYKNTPDVWVLNKYLNSPRYTVALSKNSIDLYITENILKLDQVKSSGKTTFEAVCEYIQKNGTTVSVAPLNRMLFKNDDSATIGDSMHTEVVDASTNSSVLIDGKVVISEVDDVKPVIDANNPTITQVPPPAIEPSNGDTNSKVISEKEIKTDFIPQEIIIQKPNTNSQATTPAVSKQKNYALSKSNSANIVDTENHNGITTTVKGGDNGKNNTSKDIGVINTNNAKNIINYLFIIIPVILILGFVIFIYNKKHSEISE